MAQKTQGENNFNTKYFPLASLISSGVAIVAVIALSWYIFDNKSNEQAPIEVSKPVFSEKKISQEDSNKKQIVGEGIEKYQIEISNDTQGVGDIVQAVATHIVIPKGDVTVGLIENVAGLRSDFPGAFDYAQDGHYLIKYPNGIIIYDGQLDLIVDVIRLFGGQPPVVTF